MPLSSLALDGVLGSGQNNDSGESVDPLKGLAIPTAYRCIAILSTVVASLVLEDVQKNGDSDRWPVLDNLNSYTAFEIMELITARIAGWGNFFGKKVMDGNTLVDLIPYPAEDVTVIKKRGVKTFRIKNRNDDGTLQIDSSQPNSASYTDIPDGPDCVVLHIPGMGFDGLQGVSPILLAAQTFGTSLAADKLAARFYSRGQQLGGILKVKAPLADQKQADAIKHQWRNSHSGIRNAGDVAILDAETDFQAITIAPEALQFLQSRQWQAWEVAKMLGIPAYMVEQNVTWGTGIEQQNIGFVTYTIRSYSDRIEQRFTREFAPRGHLLEFDLDRLMRGSMTERYQAYGQGIGWGWLLRSEVRKKERMKPLDSKFGLDKPLEVQSMNGALADGPLNTPPLPNGQAPDKAPQKTPQGPQDSQKDNQSD
jgi:HK97 family phage portal protein